MKIAPSGIGAIVLALFFAVEVRAQNVGIGFTSPQSKLTVNGNFALGTNYNVVAPANGALIEGQVAIGTTAPDPLAQLTVVGPAIGNNGAQITLRGIASSSTGGTPNFFMENGSGTVPSCLFYMQNTAGNEGFLFAVDPYYKNLNQFYIQDLSAGKVTRFTISPSGYVGIGTETPRAPLDVPIFASDPLNGGTQTFFDFNNTSTLNNNAVTSQTNNIAAIFAGDVMTNGAFNSYSGTIISASDARLKNIIGRSDSAKDLQTLEKIEVTDYTMKDAVKYGNKLFKKVIAQQVEKVYPAAVSSIGVKGLTFVPDIYSPADSVKADESGVYTIRLLKAHGLKDGDTVRLITPKHPELIAVVHVLNDKAFTVESKEPLGNRVFVYGRECTDLRGVDYDAISMLNVSATQELAKKVEALEQQNSDLQAENQRLSAIEGQEKQDRAEIASLKAKNEKVEAMAAKIEILEKALATMQEKENGDVRTVALKQ
jgi:hypothetical protein